VGAHAIHQKRTKSHRSWKSTKKFTHIVKEKGGGWITKLPKKMEERIFPVQRNWEGGTTGGASAERFWGWAKEKSIKKIRTPKNSSVEN